MANTSQSKKRARQSEVRNLRNSAQRSRLRTAVKRVRQAIASKDKAAARQALVGSQKVIDSMVNKHLIHKNKAARHKSRLNAAIKSLSTGA